MNRKAIAATCLAFALAGCDTTANNIRNDLLRECLRNGQNATECADMAERMYPNAKARP